MIVRLSLWFPDWKPADYDVHSLSSHVDNPIRQGVLMALLSVLCDERHFVVQNRMDGTDQCRTVGLSKNSAAATTIIAMEPTSIIESDPEVLVRRMEQNHRVWSTWIIRYTVVDPGMAFREEARQQQQQMQPTDLGTDSDQLLAAAVRSMEEYVQLIVDHSISQRTLDPVLNSQLNQSSNTGSSSPLRVFSSIIQNEMETFGELQDMLGIRNHYDPQQLSAMRVTGILAMIGTIVAYWFLNVKAKQRRSRILKKERELEAKRQTADPGYETRLLYSPEGVEEMLVRSCSVTKPSTTHPHGESRPNAMIRGGSNRSVRSPSPFSPQELQILDECSVAGLSVQTDGSVECTNMLGIGSADSLDEADVDNKEILKLPDTLWSK